MSRAAHSRSTGVSGTASFSPDRRFDTKIESQLRLLLVSGGDCRIQPDPQSRRNRYGTPVVPAADEIWLSSSTASAVTENGFLAAGESLAELIGRAEGLMRLPDWFDRARQRLAAIYCPQGCNVVLAPSGTDAELITLGIASALMDGPLCNIVVAPGETGAGVMMAASGSHFQTSASYAPSVIKGRRLKGWGLREIDALSVEIRERDGKPRLPGEIDADVATLAGDALRRGCNVLLHVLDTSKTGLSGLTRETAAEIARHAPGRVMVVVDSCQLRCSSETVRDDLERGFVVQVSGSKFAGGPAFCGALLLPPAIIDCLADCPGLPEGLADYSALLDWPADLRKGPASTLTATVNIGLALRWYAALAELQDLEKIESSLCNRILSRFDEIVAEIMTDAPYLAMPDDDPHAMARRPGIIPMIVTDGAGHPASSATAENLHRRLRQPDMGPAIHLGQAVAIGERTALRVCASAQHVVTVADAMQNGSDMDTAFAPVAAQVDALLRKLSAIGI